MLASLIKPQVFVAVVYFLEIPLEVLEGDDHRASAVVGVEGERLPVGLRVVLVVEQCRIEEEMDVMFCIVDKAEGRDAARLEPKILHHTLGRSKGELAGRVLSLCQEGSLKTRLEVVDVVVVVAVEANEVVLIALVVAHEDILAVHRAIVLPPAFSLLDGLALGVFVAGEWYVVCLEEVKDFLASF